MKRILLAAVALLCAANLFAGGLTVKSGDVSVLKTPAQAKVVFDYSKTYVGEDGAKTKTLTQYLKSRGADFVKDWPNDHVEAESYFINRFNKKNKKGLTIAEGGKPAYIITVKVEVLDMGNAAAAAFGMSSKAGGAIMWGKVFVKDARKGKVLLTVDVDEVKGLKSYSETTRLGLCYGDLATRLAKLK